MKKFLMSLLFSKKQREVIWQAMIFSEYTYRRRGNVDAAAVVQTVINETKSTIGVVKDKYTQEEVDFIVANVIRDTKNESEKHIRAAYNKGVESCKEELSAAYRKGIDDTMAKIAGVSVGIVRHKIEEDEKNEGEDAQDSTAGEGEDTNKQEGTDTADQGGQNDDAEESEEKKEE